MRRPTRRRFIAAATGGLWMLAGCTDGRTQSGGTIEDTSTVTPVENASPDEGPPTADRSLPEDYTFEELNEAIRSGGPGKDGIPSVDEPQFTPATDPPAGLDPDDPVFGVAMNGEAKAYPQYNLVWHEIVNDVLGGEPVAVTYCPLTGTAQGFFRGDVEFGVSGKLINANLVMYDRDTDSYWPQILARGITGPMRGAYLQEFRVIWTTWERWRSANPDTSVLTEDTGYARNYGRDPYGSYNPRDGYYEEENTLFPPLATDDRFHPKEVVIGARTEDGALAVPKSTVREQTVVERELDGVPYATVYDESLDTAYVYRNQNDRSVDADGGITVDGEPFAPASLPLDGRIAFDAMWMAWYGYYPSTVLHQ